MPCKIGKLLYIQDKCKDVNSMFCALEPWYFIRESLTAFKTVTQNWNSHLNIPRYSIYCNNFEIGFDNLSGNTNTLMHCKDM